MTNGQPPDAPDPFGIQPCDVLLFHGNSFVSWGIRRFDGSDVNHAALAVGPTTMIEAAGDGLRSSPIAGAVAGNERTYVRRLGGGYDLTPVREMGEAYLAKGVPYAYQQIVLLAFLSITRKLPIGDGLLRRVMRVALDKGAQLLNSFMEDGKELMICSEYVFRCYADTMDAHFALEILPPDQRPQQLAAVGDVRLLDWATQRPEPGVPSAIEGAPVPSDPDAIAAQAEAELEPLIASFALEDSPEDPEVAARAPSAATLAVGPEVSDTELLAAATTFRDAALAHELARGGVQPSSISLDPWGAFEPVADFITPGDLLYCTSLSETARLP